ncbi:hypothetical protein B6U98_01095 [Thermoplasmatales archaeon ex4572_165]|nr:MAG: hypothetical protein B6U98_01095 [Thermoplasmatales archaeon ex4572_165]RLF59786.1 MAG: hypothetical protein DRN27_01550 [Thermoplasmata archaeon]
MNKIYYLFIIISLLINSSIAISLNQDEDLKIIYNFDSPSFQKIQINGTIYDEITIPNLSTMADPGLPSLPIKGGYISIPYNSNVKSISATYSNQINLGKGFIIKPGSTPVPMSHQEQAQAPIANTQIYTSDTMYPGTLYSEIGTYKCKGFEILVLTLHPIQYIPKTGEIIFYSSIEITIEVSEKQNNYLESRGLEEDIIQINNMVDNPQILNSYPLKTKTTSMESYDYLIITTQELKEGFIPLQQTQEKRGIKTQIKTLRDITLTPNYITPEDIREYIKQQYQHNGIEYVLIGGDADIVPAKMLYVYGLDEEKWPYETFLPSDLYYSCLDGTYNNDGDDRWGEPTDGENGNDVDLFAEVYVGRASVGDLIEVGYFVNKTISYLSTSNSNEYINTFLMAGEYLGSHGVASWGGNYLDLLIDEASEDGYITSGIPSEKFQINKLYDRENEWTANDMINAINDGVHVINHDGHSNYGYNMKMVNGHVYSLTNDEYCFAYSVGCMAGGFDDPQGSDCFAEYLTVKTDHGAFAAIMNARYGWFWSHSTDGDGTRFAREFWDSVFGEKTPVISKANQDSKEDNLYLIGRSCMRWTYYELNLFGDPTISLRVSEPPNTPDMPNGPQTGKIKINYEYATTSIDSEGDDIYYLFNWGDGTYSEWLGPYSSGEEIKEEHQWLEHGDYQIQVKAKDEHGAESEWSDYLILNIPKNKNIQFPFLEWIIEQIYFLKMFFLN